MNDILMGLTVIGVAGGFAAAMLSPRFQQAGYLTILASLLVSALVKYKEGDTARCVLLLSVVAFGIAAYVRECRRAVK